MAQDKDERAATTSPRRAAETEDKKTTVERAAARPAGNGGTAQDVPGLRRQQQYVMALRRPGPAPMAGQPPSIDEVVEYLGRQEGIEVVARVKPAGIQPFAFDGGSSREVLVARMAEDKAESLQSAAQAQLVIERDAPLGLADGSLLPTLVSGQVSGGPGSLLPLLPIASELALRIVGERDQPLAQATVVAYGSGFPVQAVTDDSGTARLVLHGGGADSVQALYVKPKANHWERLMASPQLGESGTTTLKLRPLAETFPNLANERGERTIVWGQQLMHTSETGNLTGAGVRIGLIDSGCDNSHPALRHVVHGKDFTARQRDAKRGDNGWTEDVAGYGTHGAGLAAAAPAAEVHAFKVFPGGRLSDLLAALDECIAREIDIVTIGVGCGEGSELLDQKMRELRQKGIACIAAAGSLPFPAVLPDVLAVGAIGKLHEFPSDTCHAQAVMPQLIGSDGIFPAAFTGVGPHVAVSAPGVAVLSTVPGGHAALDGTGIAAAQVAAMAALVLAHHPLFQGPLKGRSEQRVSALFGLVRACAVPRFADPLRGGAGVPDLQRVPGLYGTAVPSAYADFFGAGRTAPAGIEPFGYGTGYAQGWQAVMQMRAAGLI